MNLEKLREAAALKSDHMKNINQKIKEVEVELIKNKIMTDFIMAIDEKATISWEKMGKRRHRLMLNLEGDFQQFIFCSDNVKMKYYKTLDQFIDKLSDHIISEYKSLSGRYE